MKDFSDYFPTELGLTMCENNILIPGNEIWYPQTNLQSPYHFVVEFHKIWYVRLGKLPLDLDYFAEQEELHSGQITWVLLLYDHVGGWSSCCWPFNNSPFIFPFMFLTWKGGILSVPSLLPLVTFTFLPFIAFFWASISLWFTLL